LDIETIQIIIEKLEELKEIELLNLTDFDKPESSEDRMSYAKGYIECGDLIFWLKQELYGNK
jgi:hypothetical protein